MLVLLLCSLWKSHSNYSSAVYMMKLSKGCPLLTAAVWWSSCKARLGSPLVASQSL